MGFRLSEAHLNFTVKTVVSVRSSHPSATKSNSINFTPSTTVFFAAFNQFSAALGANSRVQSKFRCWCVSTNRDDTIRNRVGCGSSMTEKKSRFYSIDSFSFNRAISESDTMAASRVDKQKETLQYHSIGGRGLIISSLMQIDLYGAKFRLSMTPVECMCEFCRLHKSCIFIARTAHKAASLCQTNRYQPSRSMCFLPLLMLLLYMPYVIEWKCADSTNCWPAAAAAVLELEIEIKDLEELGAHECRDFFRRLDMQ